MGNRKLFSSDEIISALRRLGFEVHRKPKGSHLSMQRRRDDGSHDVTVIPCGEREVPKGTFDSILQLANVDYETFLAAAKVKEKSVRHTLRSESPTEEA